MSRVRLNHSIFPLGEVSPSVLGNVDIEMYNNALQTCQNFLPSAVGGLAKRTGSEFLVQLPEPVDGLSPLIFPYYVYGGEDEQAFLIVIVPQQKANQDDKFHEPRIRFFSFDNEDWVRLDDESIFEIKFISHKEMNQYIFPICPSFEQLQNAKTIENGNSIIFFSQYYPLVIFPSTTGTPFQIKIQNFTFEPYSFATAGLIVYPRTVNMENETPNQPTPLMINNSVTYDIMKDDAHLLEKSFSSSPPIFFSGSLEYGTDLILENGEEVFNLGYFISEKSALGINLVAFGNMHQRFRINFKNNDPNEPDLEWNGRIEDVRITRNANTEYNTEYITSLVVKWINDECPKDAAKENQPHDTPGNNPTTATVPANGPQRTSTWFISAIGLDSSLLGDILFNETDDDKKVWVNQMEDTGLKQTRNPDSNYPGLTRGGGGFPRSVFLFENRLFLANIGNEVNGIWGSSLVHNDWFNFKPGINESDGIRGRISAREGSYINWLTGVTRMFVGTRDGVYICGSVSSNNDVAITPGNFAAKLISGVSTSELPPIIAGDSVLFLAANNIMLYEIVLDNSGIYRTNNISMLSEDLLMPGVVSHTWVEYPDKCYWAALKDGTLRSMTYQKNNNIIGWARHYLGSNFHGAFVKSVHTLLHDTTDQLAMVVERVINGKNVLYLERIQNTAEKRKDVRNINADCAKIFSIDYGIYAVKKSTPFTLTTNINLYNESLEHKLLFWVDEEKDDTLFTYNRERFLFDVGSWENWQYKIIIRYENSEEIYERMNPPEGYDSDVHIFVWKNCVFSISEDGIITLSSSGNPNDIKYNTHVVLWGIEASFGDETESADYGKNKNAVFWIKEDGIVCSRTEDHEPIHFVLNQAVPFSFTPFFDVTTLTISPDNYTPVVNARMVLNVSVDDLKESLESQIVDDNAYFRIVSLNRFPNLNNSSYVVPKNDDEWQVEPYKPEGETNPDPNKCQIILIQTKDVPYMMDDEASFPDLSDEPELTVVSVGDVFIFQKYLRGLEHLNGETVRVNINGNDIGKDFEVDSVDDFVGIELEDEQLAWIAYVGYAYESIAFSVPAYVPSPLVGSSIGLTSHQKEVVLKLYNSVGGYYGSTEEDVIPIEYRRVGNVTDEPLAPYSGTVNMPQTNFSLDSNTFYIKHDTAESFSLLCVTQDIFIADDAV